MLIAIPVNCSLQTRGGLGIGHIGNQGSRFMKEYDRIPVALKITSFFGLYIFMQYTTVDIRLKTILLC